MEEEEKGEADEEERKGEKQMMEPRKKESRAHGRQF